MKNLIYDYINSEIFANIILIIKFIKFSFLFNFLLFLIKNENLFTYLKLINKLHFFYDYNFSRLTEFLKKDSCFYINRFSVHTWPFLPYNR